MNELHRILTGVDKRFRYAALLRVVDPEQKILVGEWAQGNERCLFALMGMAAMRRPLTDDELCIRPIARMLGLTEGQVERGVDVWDDANNQQRHELRVRVRKFLVVTYPVITHFGQDPETTKPASVGVLAKVAALVAAKLVG